MRSSLSNLTHNRQLLRITSPDIHKVTRVAYVR